MMLSTSGATDISWLGFTLGFILLVVPVVIAIRLKLGLLKDIAISVIRMTIQLLLIGIFLTYIFQLNLWWLNLIWFLMMVSFATTTAIRRSGLKSRVLIAPILIAFIITALSVLLYFTSIILELADPFEAQYFIPLGGMILGNAMKSTIIGIRKFYSDIRKEEHRIQYRLGNGATLMEAIFPYFRQSLIAAYSPTLASMGTLGIVSLPGMMTGQIVSGSDPTVAVKYQIAIYLAILAGVALSTFLAIMLTLRFSFKDTGNLKREIYKDNDQKYL